MQSMQFWIANGLLAFKALQFIEIRKDVSTNRIIWCKNWLGL